MFLKKAAQRIPLQYAILFALAILAAMRFFFEASVPEYKIFATYTLYLASALVLMLIMWKYKLSEPRKYHSAMLLLLLTMFFLDATQWKSLIFVFSSIAVFYPCMFSVYSKNHRYNLELIAGMAVGLFSFLYSPLIILIVFVYALIISHRLVSLRCLLLPVAGLFLFFIYVWAVCFITNYPISVLSDNFISQFCDMRFLTASFNIFELIIFGIIVILYIATAYRMIRKHYTKNILLRKKCSLLLFLSFFFLTITMFTPQANKIPVLGFISILCMMLSEEEQFIKNPFFYNLSFIVTGVVNIINIIIRNVEVL